MRSKIHSLNQAEKKQKLWNKVQKKKKLKNDPDSGPDPEFYWHPSPSARLALIWRSGALVLRFCSRVSELLSWNTIWLVIKADSVKRNTQIRLLFPSSFVLLHKFKMSPPSLNFKWKRTVSSYEWYFSDSTCPCWKHITRERLDTRYNCQNAKWLKMVASRFDGLWKPEGVETLAPR